MFKFIIDGQYVVSSYYPTARVRNLLLYQLLALVHDFGIISVCVSFSEKILIS